MGLRFGWRASTVIESVWRDDDALDLDKAPPSAVEDWKKDMEASHLLPYATKGQPQIIFVRSVTPEQKAIVDGCYVDGGGGTYEASMRAWLAAFRMAVTFKGKEEQYVPSGAKHGVMVREKGGIPMLALPFVHELMEQYPGIVAFYGSRIIEASQATVAEKKASSPPSTPTPSSAGESTTATTETSPTAAGA